MKEFWLGLGEDERRNLVKIDKDTMLKKMKKQEKHRGCSCALCGRKRWVVIPTFSSGPLLLLENMLRTDLSLFFHSISFALLRVPFGI